MGVENIFRSRTAVFFTGHLSTTSTGSFQSQSQQTAGRGEVHSVASPTHRDKHLSHSRSYACCGRTSTHHQVLLELELLIFLL